MGGVASVLRDQEAATPHRLKITHASPRSRDHMAPHHAAVLRSPVLVAYQCLVSAFNTNKFLDVSICFSRNFHCQRVLMLVPLHLILVGAIEGETIIQISSQIGSGMASADGEFKFRSDWVAEKQV